MNKLFRRSIVALVLAAILVAGMGYFLVEYAMQGQSWATQIRNPHVFTNGILDDLRITDRNGTVLFSSEGGRIVWHEDEAVRKAVLHAIGDLQGNIGGGVLHRYRKELIDFGHFNGVYTYANGGATLLLYLDASLCAAAGRALGDHDGAIGVLNYKTGELYALVSAANFDPITPPGVDAAEGAYINRFLSAVYTPGSIYKIVTLQAAIESLPELESMSFTCKGKSEIGGEVITCSGYHGQQDIAQAFANSCNCAFGELAVTVGLETIRECADRAGLLSAGWLDGQETAVGYLAQEVTQAQLAWTGIGQHVDTVNPAAFLRYVGAIANSGEAVSMRLCGSRVKGNGVVHQAAKEDAETIMDEQTAQRLAGYMQNNVDRQYGAWRFGSCTVGAKSGTAQQDNAAAHSVFTGFVTDENMPIAFFVIAEHAGAGQGVAMRAAATLVQQAQNMQ